jgi:hypothetical protein
MLTDRMVLWKKPLTGRMPTRTGSFSETDNDDDFS